MIRVLGGKVMIRVGSKVMISVLAPSYADWGADNRDNLAWSRCPSLHNSFSRLLAMVQTLGFFAFPFLRVLRRFDTSLHATSVLRRC
jgi:hypothetical protein